MVNISKREYEALLTLIDIVNGYLNNQKRLENLSRNIKLAVTSFEEIDKKYRDILFEYWSYIEQLYAVMCMEERDIPNEEEKALLDSYLYCIKNICDQLVTEYHLPLEDPYAWPFPDDRW